MWCCWNGIRGTALERVCSATLCVSVLFCRDLAKLGYITLLDYFMCNDVNREGDLTSQSKAPNKSGRYLDLLCRCAGADLPSTVRYSESTWCTSGKAGKAARLCTGTPTRSGNSNTAQRQRAAAALRLLLAASCATAAGHHSRCTREGLIAARQQNTQGGTAVDPEEQSTIKEEAVTWQHNLFWPQTIVTNLFCRKQRN